MVRSHFSVVQESALGCELIAAKRTSLKEMFGRFPGIRGRAAAKNNNVPHGHIEPKR
jgi:hypothetical protein